MNLDMWPLRALFLLLWFSGGSWCNECNMTKVYFESRNFHSRLHWDEVKIKDREVRYSVSYNEYGEQPTLMTGCENISEPFCDLSSVMTDIRSKYFIKIMADELCLGELRHLVLSEKPSLEAPTLSVETTESSLVVTLRTPMGPQNRSIQEITCFEMCHKSGQSSVNYIVSLTHPESEAGKKFENKSGTITLSHLDANTEYCGVVFYKLTHPSIKGQSENTTFCRTLPAAGKPWIPVFLVSGLVAVFLLITLALILCQQYVTRKRNLPKALIMSINTPPVFKTDSKVEITNVKVYPASPRNGKKSDLALPVSPAGYAAQGYRNQDCHSHSYTNEQMGPVSGQSAGSFTSYSMVLGRKETRDRGLSSCANDSGLGDSMSPDLSSFTEEDPFQVTPPAEPEDDMGMIKPDSTSKLLVLPVSRGANGKLSLLDLAFPSSEITPLATRSTATGERTLLLTDLVSMDEPDWTDNRSSVNYRKSYLPNGVPQSCLEIHSTETISKVLLSDFTADYRENWVPGILPEPLEYNRNCMISDNQLHELVEPEQNVNETPPQFQATFLGEWMVQIQG